MNPHMNPQVRRSRGLVLTAAVSVALISTGSAYLAMVAFGVDVLEMSAGTAYAYAGVFELSLVTVALLAREAAKDNRPGGTLLTLTWLLSSASGAFAAWHELFIDHPLGAAIFRFLVPLLAALMWHLALIGDRHLATGMSWSGMRQSRRMHALFLSTEDLFRAQSFADGSRSSRRRLKRTEAIRRRARAVALRTVPPTEMRAQVAAWSEAMAAVGDGTGDVARLHQEDRRRLTAAGTLSDETAIETNPRRELTSGPVHSPAETRDDVVNRAVHTPVRADDTVNHAADDVEHAATAPADQEPETGYYETVPPSYWTRRETHRTDISAAILDEPSAAAVHAAAEAQARLNARATVTPDDAPAWTTKAERDELIWNVWFNERQPDGRQLTSEQVAERVGGTSKATAWRVIDRNRSKMKENRTAVPSDGAVNPTFHDVGAVNHDTDSERSTRSNAVTV